VRPPSAKARSRTQRRRAAASGTPPGFAQGTCAQVRDLPRKDAQQCGELIEAGAPQPRQGRGLPPARAFLAGSSPASSAAVAPAPAEAGRPTGEVDMARLGAGELFNEAVSTTAPMFTAAEHIEVLGRNDQIAPFCSK
jgi:hypothetical protein